MRRREEFLAACEFLQAAHEPGSVESWIGDILQELLLACPDLDIRTFILSFELPRQLLVACSSQKDDYKIMDQIIAWALGSEESSCLCHKEKEESHAILS